MVFEPLEMETTHVDTIDEQRVCKMITYGVLRTSSRVDKSILVEFLQTAFFSLIVTEETPILSLLFHNIYYCSDVLTL